MVPNDRLMLVKSELDRSIDLVFQAMEADSAQELTRLVPTIGVAAIKKLYQLADDHAKYSLSADIAWQRRGEVRKRVHL